MNKTSDVHTNPDIARLAHTLALDGYNAPSGLTFKSKDKYKRLTNLGSHLWLDTGDAAAAAKVWAAETDALTTNNTLVNQVVQTGAMDKVIADAAKKIHAMQPDLSAKEMVMEIGFLVNAKLALSLVQKFGANVSVELHPDIGFDIERTLDYARRYYAICPEFFYVKVPMTPDGFVSVRKLSQEGIPVNYTLGFSARQNLLAAAFSKPAFVNVFLGRLNSLVEENELGQPENVGEKAALASFEAVRKLRETDTNIPTRQIAASLRNGNQVATLAGIDVLTIPPKAAQEYLDLNVNKVDIRLRESIDLRVSLNPDNRWLARKVIGLWDIDHAFEEFVDDAVAKGDEIKSGRDLVELAKSHRVDLFHDWTTEEFARLREKGKIPDVQEWPGIAFDDLMSMSALQSFVKDQDALDKRIARLMG